VFELTFVVEVLETDNRLIRVQNRFLKLKSKMKLSESGKISCQIEDACEIKKQKIFLSWN
jgi:hypothetical protein